MTELERAIREQPEQLRRLAELDVAREAAAVARAARVLLVGTGTSLHAADLGARMLTTAGLDARSGASFDVATSASPRAEDAVVVITHTGETAFARTVRARALEAGATVVSITGDGVGWPEAIETGARERSETYTRSYLATLAVLTLIAGELGADGFGPQAVRAAADAVERVVEAPPSLPVGRRLTVLVGAGPWAVTAREGALKLREAAGLIAEGYDPEHLLHGSAIPLRPGDALLALAPERDATGLLGRVAEAARQEGVTVATLEGAAGLGDTVAQLPATAALQLLALQQAGVAGRDPDHVITGAWGDDELWSTGFSGD